MKKYHRYYLIFFLLILFNLFRLEPALSAPTDPSGNPYSGEATFPEPEPFLQSLIAKYKKGNFQEALQELEPYLFRLQDTLNSVEASPTTSPENTPLSHLQDPIWKARFLFLAGYLYFQQGRFLKASEVWNLLITRIPSFILNDYGQYYLAESYRKQELYPEALQAYQTLIDRYPSSLLQAEARFQIAKVLELLKKYPEAVAAYIQFSKKFSDHPLAPKALWDSARLLEEQHSFKITLETYRNLQRSYPYSFWAAQAYKREKEIYAQYPTLEPEWNDQELYQEGERLYNLNLFSQAQETLNRLIKKFPESPFLEKALLLSGKIAYNLRENEEALKIFENFLTRYTQNKEIPRVLNLMARIYLRMENGDKFLTIYQKLNTTYPHDKWTLDTLYLLGTFYEENQQNFKKALSTYEIFLKRSPRGPRQEDALWRSAWIYYRSGEYQKSRNILIELIRKYPHSYYYEEALYWAGRASEKLRDWRKAVEFFQRAHLTHPRSYYGIRSLDHLTSLFKEHPGLQNLKVQNPDSPGQLKLKPTANQLSSTTYRQQLLKAQELTKLALYEEAARELEKALQSENKMRISSEIYRLLELYYEARNYRKLVQFSRQYFSDWLRRGDSSVPGNFWKMAYPLGYEELVRRYTTPQIDPFLVYSIMMAESEFNPDVRSPAAATGLMQLIYSTANRLAQNMGITQFSEEMLLNAELNIALGVSYLEELLIRFKGNIVPVIASYNAGEDRVEAWLRQQSGEDPEMFIAGIPYRETKKYVQRVLWYYEEYKRIYGNQ
ncbi:MAG TPA: tetratricopeptide repeat protein [Candidatus Limnocylindrales bacterium]|nr:tetratricopeptide repeat protein [Candidatus Limnocylindrales bacterium]